MNKNVLDLTISISYKCNIISIWFKK